MQIPAAFDYERATSVENALELLQSRGPEARLLAGGREELSVRARQGRRRPVSRARRAALPPTVAYETPSPMGFPSSTPAAIPNANKLQPMPMTVARRQRLRSLSSAVFAPAACR